MRPAFAAVAVGLGLAAGLTAAGVRGPADVSDRGHYLDGPPLAHTGGFGEPTCHACHFDGPLNDDAGGFALLDRSVAKRARADRDAAARANTVSAESYHPGETHRFTLRLTRPDMAAAGFELSARFADGPRAGRQAGELRVPGEHAEVVRVQETSVDYARHTAEGTTPGAPDTARWTIEWTAPEDGGAVVFHAAANAANGDVSEFGDWIYADSVVLLPAR